MKTVSFVDYPKQHQKYPEIEEAILRVCNSKARILQDEVRMFEENLAKFVGTKYAVALNSGTDALFLSLKLLGIGNGDEVITVGHTFHATVEAIHWNGATPVLVDVYDTNSTMDIDACINAITEKTKAIIPVHLMGDMVNMEALKYRLSLLGREDIYIIEDACQALGSESKGIKAGAWGTTGCFSFFPAKILGSYGDGGAVTTNDEELYKELKDIREHYKYNPGKWGFNSRMDELQAAILNVKIWHLPEMIKRRQEIADIYDKNLLGVILPTKRKGRVYQDYIIRTDNRDELAAYLKEQGIETLKNDYHFPSDCPKPDATVKLESKTLRLPCNDVLTDGEVLYVCEKINEFYKE